LSPGSPPPRSPASERERHSFQPKPVVAESNAVEMAARLAAALSRAEAAELALGTLRAEAAAANAARDHESARADSLAAELERLRAELADERAALADERTLTGHAERLADQLQAQALLLLPELDSALARARFGQRSTGERQAETQSAPSSSPDSSDDEERATPRAPRVYPPLRRVLTD
jgi:chromosome segregation ATPase